ncbi:MAG: hypothetical protein HYV60_11910 [Planctomycetia bacterium]|nr:hypothetical protein [Planctomycetia bacterium]
MPRLSLLAPVCPCCGNEDVMLLDGVEGNVVVECYLCCVLSVAEIGENSVYAGNALVAAR